MSEAVKATITQRPFQHRDQDESLSKTRRQDLWLTLHEPCEAVEAFARSARSPGSVAISVDAANDYWDRELSQIKEGDVVLAYVSKSDAGFFQAYHLSARPMG